MIICLAGPSGTGKTTMAMHLHKEHDLPFIATSTKSLWEKFDIKSHEDIIGRSARSPKWAYEFQQRVLDHRIKLFIKHPRCTTDRSPICNAVYFLMQVSPHISYAKTLDYLKKCEEVMDGFVNGIIYIPFNKAMGLEADGMRVNNIIYQECSQLYFDYVMDKYIPINFGYHLTQRSQGIPGIRLTSPDFITRKHLVNTWLK